MKPGTDAPVSGIYKEVGPRDGAARRAVCVQGKKLPPTSKQGCGYVLDRATKRRPKTEKEPPKTLWEALEIGLGDLAAANERGLALAPFSNIVAMDYTQAQCTVTIALTYEWWDLLANHQETIGGGLLMFKKSLLDEPTPKTADEVKK